MNLTQFYEYQERTFHQYCKTLIRNAAADCKRELFGQLSHELSYSDLSTKETAQLLQAGYSDVVPTEQTLFWVQGKQVQIEDRALAKALCFLLPDQRDMVLLYYFFQYSDRAIADLLHCSAETARLRRQKALQQLRSELEAMPDDI